MTPFGKFLAERLTSVFESIEALQRLQTLLKQISEMEPDLPLLTHSRSEILTPTTSDPEAPTRRFADLLHAASHVRLLLPSAIPVLFEADSPIGDGKRALEVAVPHTAIPVGTDGSAISRQLRDAIASGNVAVFSYEGGIPYFAGTVDDVAVVGLTDHAGAVQGFVETDDEALRSWTASTVDTCIQKAVRVVVEDLYSTEAI